MKFEVNRKMLPMKAHYFFWNGATGPVVPFMPTLARQLGFSTVIVGTVYTILPIIGLLVKPLFGFVADRFQIRKAIFLACQLLTVLAFLGVIFIQPANQPADMQFHCNDGIADLRHCPAVGQPLDSCLVANLTAEAEAVPAANASSGAIMTCTMRCRTNETHQSMELCGQNRTECEYSMVAHIKMNHIELVGGCLMFVLKEAQVHNDSHPNHFAPVTCPHIREEHSVQPPHESHSLHSHCEAHCSDERVQHAISNSRVEDNNAWALPQFWAFFLCLFFSWMGMAVVVSLGDAICFHLLTDSQSHLFGNQRMWGAIGWGIFSLIAGLLVDQMSRGALLKDYSGVFYMMIVLMAADMYFSTRMEQAPETPSANVLRDIGLMFKSPAVCVFFVWCIVVGLGTALIWNFLFWHLENLADASEEHCTSVEWMKTLQGLAMAVQCFAGEIPFFFASGWLLQRVGHVHTMSLVLLALGVRFLLYSWLTNPWLVLPIEMLQGITFGIFTATMASYASIVAPPGTSTTLQGLAGAAFEGIGVAAGSFIAGHMMESLGGSMTFRLFGVAALVFFLIHVGVQMLVKKYHGGYRQEYVQPVDALNMLTDDDLYFDRL